MYHFWSTWAKLQKIQQLKKWSLVDEDKNKLQLVSILSILMYLGCPAYTDMTNFIYVKPMFGYDCLRRHFTKSN